MNNLDDNKIVPLFKKYLKEEEMNMKEDHMDKMTVTVDKLLPMIISIHNK